MASFFIAPAAMDDIESILLWTDKAFGERTRIRYAALIRQGIRDIVKGIDPSGSFERSDLGKHIRTYHLFFSRNHVPVATGRIKAPRHFIIYQSRTDGVIEISRVLHDSMEPSLHLSSEPQE